MLPFVRLWYGRQSHYTWTDESGTDHRISQGEGVEQGDPLAPLLFSLAIHRALRNAQDFLEAGESMFAFLDDVYTIASRDRAAAMTLTHTVILKWKVGVTNSDVRAGCEALAALPEQLPGTQD